MDAIAGNSITFYALDNRKINIIFDEIIQYIK